MILWKEIITPDNTVIYTSTILDETGTESEISNERPKFYPKLWNIDQLNNLKLNSNMMAESLIKNQVPNNWNRIIKEYETLIKQGRNTNVVIELKDIKTSSSPSSPPPPPPQFSPSQTQPQAPPSPPYNPQFHHLLHHIIHNLHHLLHHIIHNLHHLLHHIIHNLHLLHHHLLQ